jgi:hypothetical protein
MQTFVIPFEIFKAVAYHQARNHPTQKELNGLCVDTSRGYLVASDTWTTCAVHLPQLQTSGLFPFVIPNYIVSKLIQDCKYKRSQAVLVQLKVQQVAYASSYSVVGTLECLGNTYPLNAQANQNTYPWWDMVVPYASGQYREPSELIYPLLDIDEQYLRRITHTVNLVTTSGYRVISLPNSKVLRYVVGGFSPDAFIICAKHRLGTQAEPSIAEFTNNTRHSLKKYDIRYLPN